jgi:hypothetical protein
MHEDGLLWRYNAPMRTRILTTAEKEQLTGLIGDIRSLPSGLHAIKKEIEAISEQTKASEEAKEREAKSPRLHAELQLPEAVEIYLRTAQHAKPEKEGDGNGPVWA